MTETSGIARIVGILRRGGASVERAFLRWMIRARGVSSAVRYLRNPDPKLSVGLLEAFGAEIGPGTTIKRSLQLDNVFRDRNSTGDFRHIEIGSDCYIGDGVYFDLADRIVVGDGAIVSGHVSILTHADCNRSSYLAERFPRDCSPVHIEEGAWVGFGATLLAGTTVGANAVVAAESLVSGDVESRSLYAGTPARLVRSLDE